MQEYTAGEVSSESVTMGFCQQTRKLELHNMSPLLTLRVKGLASDLIYKTHETKLNIHCLIVKS